MEKLVVVINGKGGVGKDTLCGFAAKRFKTKNISSISPVKEIAIACGWKGEKDPKSRKFLSDLKRLLSWYNDLPNRYLLSQYQEFLAGDQQILFVHIREGDQIQQFQQGIHGRCVTLLIRRDCGIPSFGNASDDDVECFCYDYVYENAKPLPEAEEDFLLFLEKLLHQEGEV